MINYKGWTIEETNHKDSIYYCNYSNNISTYVHKSKNLQWCKDMIDLFDYDNIIFNYPNV